MRTLALFLVVVVCYGQPPPFPPPSTTPKSKTNIIMQGVTTITPPSGFDVIDKRITNFLATVTFSWDENTETNLAGYRLYQGSASKIYTNFVSFGITNQGTLVDLSRTNRNYFALKAVNAAGQESEFSNEIIWPNPPLPVYYTNFVVIVPYQFSTNSEGPWLTYTARLHYISQEGPMFWRSLPIQIERAP